METSDFPRVTLNVRGITSRDASRFRYLCTFAGLSQPRLLEELIDDYWWEVEELARHAGCTLMAAAQNVLTDRRRQRASVNQKIDKTLATTQRRPRPAKGS